VRVLYRVRQFWRTLIANAGSPELEPPTELLNPAQAALFDQLQSGEKAHALTMARRLMEQGELQADLLVAALLHDVGKLHHHLHPLERAMVVLVKAVMPEHACRWGNSSLNELNGIPRWRKAFVVAQQHAAWGAELAHQAGVSPLTETLIRLHHHPLALNGDTAETSLLRKLWLVDNES